MLVNPSEYNRDREEPGPSHLRLLLSHVAKDRQTDFIAHVQALVRDDGCFGIDLDFLGFMEDYENIAMLVRHRAVVHGMQHVLGGLRRQPVPAPQPFTVYDVGCATALQHVLFDPQVAYVGIDEGRQPEPRFFREGCRFVPGRFRDVVDTLDIDRKSSIGVANMSLLYGSSREELELFDRVFKRKIIL